MNLANVNLASLKIDGIDFKDHPDYCDAYFESGEYLDGTPLPDDVLEELKDENINLFYEMLYNSIY